MSMCAAPRFVPAVRHTDQDGVIALQLSLKAWPPSKHTEHSDLGCYSSTVMGAHGSLQTFDECIW